MKWLKTLELISNFELEKRVTIILQYLFSIDSNCECDMSNIDATGYTGNILTQAIK